MRWICIFLLLGVNSLICQHVELYIKDFSTKQAVGAANIVHAKKPIAKADQNGFVSVDMNYKIVSVYALGYDTTEVILGGNSQIVYLDKKDKRLKEVVIKPVIDAYAHRWIDLLIQQAEENHPKTLPSYQFYSYSKFVADAEQDTAVKLKNKKDSTDYIETKRLLDSSKLFVWEKLTIFKHDSRYGSKKILLNSNMSGFKQPIYEALAMTLDEVNFLPRIFRTEQYKEYYFRMEDSFYANHRKTYTISFFPFRKYKSKRSRSGYIHIDSAYAGILRYQGTTKDGFFEIQNQIVEDKFFTKELFMRMTNSMIRMDNFNTTTTYKLRVENIETPKIHEKSDFKGYDNEISVKLNDEDSKKILTQLRGEDSLNAKEIHTFQALDSMVQSQNVESKLRLLLALRSGSLKLGLVNFNILDLLQYNSYEGLRTTLSGETNMNFHRKHTIQGYIAYGFRDKKFKYGLGWTYLLNYQNQSKLSINISDDISPVGREYSRLASKINLFDYSVNAWFLDKYYQRHRFAISYQQDLHKYLEQKTWVQLERISNLFTYTYQGKTISNLDIAQLGIDLNYYPKTAYIVTPEGKHIVENKPTKLMVSYRYYHPLNETWSDFQTLQIDANSSWKNPIGKLNFSIYSGITLGDVPINYLYEGRGSANRNNQLLTTFGLGSYRYFETMQPGRLYSDKYLGLFFKQHLPIIDLPNKKKLNFSLIYKALLGDMAHPIEHSLAIESPQKLYQELGIEWDKVINKFPIGLGFYYRLGAYYQGEFEDNFATRLIVNL